MPSPKLALPVAAATAFLAGATDIYGLTRLKDVFVSFMSGNTTLLGMALGDGHWPRAGLIAGIIALFVAGAAAGAALAERSGRLHAAVVMTAVAGLLAVPLIHDAWTVPVLALAMGMLNETMGRVGSTGISLTFVTGALVKFGSGLGQWLVGRGEGWGWVVHGPLWLSLLAGAIAATLLQKQLGADALWPLTLLAVLLIAPYVALARDPSTTLT